jgi:hypothetical protein
MSYANDICTSRFSEQQQLAMRSTVNTTSAPRGYLTIVPMPNYPTLTAPTLQLPANGDTLIPNQAQFRWRSVPGADFYQLKVYVGTSFTVIDTMISDTAYLHLANKIRANRVHSWEVRAFNGAQLCTDFGQRGDFVTGLYNSSSGSENQPIQQLQVYPNLLKGGETVYIKGLTIGQTARFRLFDVRGRLLYASDQVAETELTSLQLPWLATQWLLLEVTQLGQTSRHKLLLQQP